MKFDENAMSPVGADAEARDSRARRNSSGTGELAELRTRQTPQVVRRKAIDASRESDTAVKLSLSDIEGVLPCFTPGTLIATGKGERRVETLQAGDRVITRDRGMQVVHWVGKTTLTEKDLRAQPAMRPVRLRAGCLGPDRPARDMLLSPNHRVLFNESQYTGKFAGSEVMAAAKHLTWMPGITQARAETVTYIHFMFAQHELVLSDGLWSESFQAGDYTLNALDRRQRDAIFQIFPDLKGHEGMDGFTPARRVLSRKEARLLGA